MATAPQPFIPPQSETQTKTVASAGHTIFLLVVLAAWSTWGYFGAKHARAGQDPHRIATYLLTSGWEWAVVGYIAWGARKHGTSLSELTGHRWKSLEDLLKDWGISIAFWFVAIAILAITSLAVHMPHNLENTKFLLPQTGLESALWILVSVTAGICEEIIFRGYFQKQFLAWTSNPPAAILLSAMVFGAGHIYQSGKAAIVITVYGVLFGILAYWRGNLRPGMMAHAWHDTISGLALKIIEHLKRFGNVG